MRKLLLLLLCLVATFVSNAQLQRGLKGEYNTEGFPQISFVWNTASPEDLDKSQFVLTEDGKSLDFSLSSLQPEKEGMPYKKSILFLWEDMSSHSGQYQFASELLKRFFTETDFGNNDKFSVAVFNRKKDGREVLNTITSGFESDPSTVAEVVGKYPKSRESYNTYPLQSDLYLAINSGLEMLKKEPSDQIGIIVVITAGLNVKAPGASTEMETIRKNALDAGIPVYVVKYPAFGDTPEINTLSESTFGEYTSTEDESAALGRLQGFYNDFDARCYGKDYRITFNTTAKKDGKPHTIGLSIGKVAQNIPAFTSPDMTFGEWMSENIFLFIVMVVVFLLIVALVIVLILKSKARQNLKIADAEAKMKEEVDASNRRFDQLRQHQEDKERQQQSELQRKQQEAEVERLTNIMVTKNMYPRLQCNVAGNNLAFNIVKPHVTLGRNNTNDIVLNNQTVSGIHAEINFDGNNFQIVNRSQSYSQGIVVNGQFFQQCTLKNGDMMGLGEVIITFYL